MKWQALILLLAFTTGIKAQTVLFDSLALHLPTLLEGDTTAHCVTFRFTNKGKAPVTIARTTASCGCTKVSYCPTRPVASGQCDSIVVQYKSDRNPGTIDEHIYVYSTRDDKRPIATLHVLGTIKESASSKWRHLPASMGPLRLRRKELTFNESDVVMRIPCANTSPAPLKLKAALLPPYVTLCTEPQVIEPNAEADIVVRIDRQKLPAIRPIHAAIVLDGIPCDISARRITLTIK